MLNLFIKYVLIIFLVQIVFMAIYGFPQLGFLLVVGLFIYSIVRRSKLRKTVYEQKDEAKQWNANSTNTNYEKVYSRTNKSANVIEAEYTEREVK